MLPAGFEWQHYITGPGLFVDGELVAYIAPVTEAWRVSVGIGIGPPRYQFFDREDDALRYVEAWARKWEQRIREELNFQPVRGWGPTRKP